MSRASETEKWRELVKGAPLTDDEREELVRAQAQRLIESLYEPHAISGWRASERTCRFDKDSINWGDLSVRDVARMKDGSYQVYVEEAAPDATVFQDWLSAWLGRWGWQVEIRTEW